MASEAKPSTPALPDTQAFDHRQMDGFASLATTAARLSMSASLNDGAPSERLASTVLKREGLDKDIS